MSNSKNSNLEDVSKGNDESAPGVKDSTSNKKTRFTKSKSISEVFKELENENHEDGSEFSNDLNGASVDEIVPIHNEYKDLDKSEALVDESVEGGIIINPDSDESSVKESIEFEVEELTDSIGGETDSDEFDESIDSEESEDEEFITGKTGDHALADDDIEEKIGKSSAQGVLINDKDKTPDSEESSKLFNSSTIITIVSFIIGLAILLIGITYYASSSDRVVDNVLSGETAGLAIFLVIIGLIVIGFSLLNFFSSSKSSLIIDTFNSIKSIDYDDISEDVISREDFDAVFSIFKRKKDSDSSDNDKSVDSSKDLFEKDQDDEVSDEDIDALYSDSNLTSQKNQSSFKGHENADSTEISQDFDDGDEEIIPISSKLNEQSEESDLENKYSKYDFEEDLDDDHVLVDENPEDSFDDSLLSEEGFEETEKEEFEEIVEDDYIEPVKQDSFDDSQAPAEEDYMGPIDFDPFDEIENRDDSSSQQEKMDGLEDKYSKYDFDDNPEELNESTHSKPKFKKSVDLSQFERQELSEEELAERERKTKDLAEKKRRIIEGTNFDNSLRN